MKQTKFIRLETLYTKESMSEGLTKDLIDAGLDPVEAGDTDIIYVNPEHIVACNFTNNKRQITMRLSNGENWLVLMSMDNFMKEIRQYNKELN